ncbi:Bsp6I family type II restriction endonuclease [Parvimonas parva]|uniref:Bsp6I family type II restriction endonuclease n=1 Tax=Parvimonas parva TaxID=2769485 RepID=A0ABS1C6Y5_9FIRM|nr:Bsp6I family type II restriction endonuclease [Parvimonas parva]MBK1467861.1 Bsp6I family type II restriction endonuclease [Parvimonas parva]CRH60255.1 Bsp6I restriction endonuclease [Chlamydia trachomatis]
MKKITETEYKKIISQYPLWKNLNNNIKSLYSRGVNFHEVFSEFIVCYVNNYYHSLGAGSEDAFTENMDLKVQIKGSSNFNSDLTSFGPTSEFDILEFARLDQDEDKLYLYRIPIDELYDVHVNKKQTFKQQQLEGRRPRFSIISNYIEKYNLNPYAVVDMISGNYSFY